MGIQFWIPSIATTGLLVIVLWMARKFIASVFVKSVEYGFSRKLEGVRAEFNQRELLLKADIQAKATELAVLRSGALSAMESRQIALDRRRLEAADQIWSAVIMLGRAKSISAIMSGLKFGPTVDLAHDNPDLREVFKIVGEGVDAKAVFSEDAAKARPFVSPMTWALFSAYQAIIGLSVAKVQMIKLGMNNKELLDMDAIASVLKVALPTHARYIDEYGEAGYHKLLDALEVRLMEEMLKTLQGVESDKASVEQAAGILMAAGELKKTSHGFHSNSTE